MTSFKDFEKKVEENAPQNNRADFFKLHEGENKLVILTAPEIYSEVFKIGIVYHGAEYAPYGSVRAKCYVKDLADGKIKIATLNYTITKDIVALGKGARTRFDSFPMPYAIIIDVKNVGTLKQETKVIADEDYVLSAEDIKELEHLDDITIMLNRMKDKQEKEVASDWDLQKKIADFMEKKKVEQQEKNAAPKEDLPTINVDDGGEQQVDPFIPEEPPY